MKAPMTAISGFVSLIQGGSLYLDNELRSYLTRISGESDELSRRVTARQGRDVFAPSSTDALAETIKNPPLCVVHSGGFFHITSSVGQTYHPRSGRSSALPLSSAQSAR